MALLLVAPSAALAFQPAMHVSPRSSQRPALVRHSGQASMLLDGAMASWLADAAILLPDTDSAAVAADAAQAAAESPGWFDRYALPPCPTQRSRRGSVLNPQF